jgi:hypothetical protein
MGLGQHHTRCDRDRQRRQDRDRWAPEHTETGLDQTLARLAGHGRPEQLPVAIERASGLIVDRLLAAGHPVIPIHPNAFHATRPRWGAARGQV